MLPAITFIFSRKACDEARDACLDAGLRLTTPDERARIRAIVDERTAALADADLDVLGFDRFLAGLEMGVAAHHAGMVPPFKEAVEACFTEGLTKAVFATETLALGVNMPARSVVIERLTKFARRAPRAPDPRRVHAAHRPGRPARASTRSATPSCSGRRSCPSSRSRRSRRAAPTRSGRRSGPPTTWRPTSSGATSPTQAHHLLNLSFAQFQADKAVVRLEARIERQQERLARLRGGGAAASAATSRSTGACGPRPASGRAAGRTATGGGSAERTNAALSRLAPGDVVVVDGTQARGAERGVPQGQPAPARRRRAQQAAHDRRRRARRAAASRRHGGAPEPYNPNNRAFQHQVGESLRRARVGRGGHRGPEPRRTSQRPRRRRLRRRRGPSRRRLPRPRRAPAERRAGRAGRPRARGPAATGPGPHRSRSPAASIGCCGSSRRGATSTAGPSPTSGRGAGPHVPRVRSARRRGDDLRRCSTTSTSRRWPRSCPASPTSTAGATARPSRGSRQLDRARRASSDLRRLADELTADEEDAGLPTTRPPDAGFVHLAHAWAAGDGLATVLEDEELSGGDFVRNVKQLDRPAAGHRRRRAGRRPPPPGPARPPTRCTEAW